MYIPKIKWGKEPRCLQNKKIYIVRENTVTKVFYISY